MKDKPLTTWGNITMSDYIRNLREKTKLSQEYLAKKMSMSRQTYIQIENGRRDLYVHEARKLAEIFNISLDDFLQEKTVMEPNVTLERNLEAKTVSTSIDSIRVNVPRESVEKFKEVLLYILVKIGSLPNIGESVLCKLLYFIDFDYYERFEEHMIGAKYVKNHHGPTPVEFKKIIEEMMQEKDLEKIKSRHFQHEQTKYLPIREPNRKLFTVQEIDHIDYEINRFKSFNATKMSEYSHRDVPWLGTKNRGIIDYEAVFYRTPEFSFRNYTDNEV